jgi:ParB family chromosome partitioning protein
MEEIQKGQNPVRRNALGKGLSALMSVTKQPVEPRAFLPKQEGESESPTETATGKILYLKLSELTPNPDQPRKHFKEAELKELADSIKETGLIQPIIARKRNETFEIVAGERRYRASKIAGLSEVPVVLRELSDKETLAIGIIENVQRQDLNPLEEALAYQKLIDDFEETQSSIAKSVGKDRASIANALRLLKLPEKVKVLLSNGKLSAGHGRALLMCNEEQKIIEIAERAILEGLSVRAVEQLTSQKVLLIPHAPEAEEKKTPGLKWTIEKHDPTLKRLEDELSDKLRRSLGTKVQVSLSSESKGEVKISFFSKEELESLIERVQKH